MAPKWRLEFDPEAIQETRAARAWYGARSEKAEKAFLVELREAIRKLRESPERWPKFAHGARRIVLHKFPFSLVYRVRESMIQVIALAHDKRRPGYWRWRR